ncbi:MAG: tetratricopeptide repeat protein [Bdellovibrionales bacterium]
MAPHSQEMLKEARQYFVEAKYKMAEPILEQLLLQNLRNPEIYQMLATIYYDRGQFNKAIKTFKRALEIDPSYTDASVGLSIILNDLGRYEEGRQVFVDARKILDDKKKPSLGFMEENISRKHEELADLYAQARLWTESLENLQKALKITPNRRRELGVKVAEAYQRSGESQKAIRELKELLFIDDDHVEARMKLADLLHRTNRTSEALEHWEAVLMKDPQNQQAREQLTKYRKPKWLASDRI